jgi:glycolate oxidase FAD binding subunit
VIIDGVPAGKTVQPKTVAELSQCIREEKGTLVPMGAGTQLEFGNPLRGADTVLDLRGLSRITTYNPAELTIHVEAGTPLVEIQSALSANGQALPLDPWSGPQATIGGIAAANAQGPLRATGSIRDWIIGMTVVHADGAISKTGGRVVKNVTGHDLAKLYTGSLGSLAVIAEISFKLRPAYDRTATAVAEFADLTAAAAALAAIRKGPLQPIACEFSGPKPAIRVRFGEHARAVDWQLSRLPAAQWRIAEGEAEQAEWAKLREHFQGMGSVVVKAAGLPTEVPGILEAFAPAAWLAHALNGIVYMAVPDAAVIARIRERFPAVVERAPAEVRRQAGTFGVRGTAKNVMRELKQTFDPQGRLNPGRHIDGE